MSTYVSYRGYTILSIAGGVWLVAALPGRPFEALGAAKRAIDQAFF